MISLRLNCHRTSQFVIRRYRTWKDNKNHCHWHVNARGRQGLGDLILTCKYGRLCRPIFSPFRYRRVLELFRMTNIWNGNNSEGMTLLGRSDNNSEGVTTIQKEWQYLEGMTKIRKEWQKSGRNDSSLEGITIMQKEWHKVFFWNFFF